MTLKMMIKICAIIQVKDFIALEQFEREIKPVMQDHHGKIVLAFESQRNDDGSGEEIHLLEFSSIEKFNAYKNDDRLKRLYQLRELAIANIEIKLSKKLKCY